MNIEANITISCLRGGFVVTYPDYVTDEATGLEQVQEVQEVATSIGKAVRIAKGAVERFSLVKKDAADEA